MGVSKRRMKEKQRASAFRKGKEEKEAMYQSLGFDERISFALSALEPATIILSSIDIDNDDVTKAVIALYDSVPFKIKQRIVVRIMQKFEDEPDHG